MTGKGRRRMTKEGGRKRGGRREEKVGGWKRGGGGKMGIDRRIFPHFVALRGYGVL